MKNSSFRRVSAIFFAFFSFAIYPIATLIYIWSIIIAYLENGTFMAVLTGFIPPVAQVYWFIVVLIRYSALSNYCLACYALALCFIGSMLLSLISDSTDNNKKDIGDNICADESTQKEIEQIKSETDDYINEGPSYTRDMDSEDDFILEDDQLSSAQKKLIAESEILLVKMIDKMMPHLEEDDLKRIESYLNTQRPNYIPRYEWHKLQSKILMHIFNSYYETDSEDEDSVVFDEQLSESHKAVIRRGEILLLQTIAKMRYDLSKSEWERIKAIADAKKPEFIPTWEWFSIRMKIVNTIYNKYYTVASSE